MLELHSDCWRCKKPLTLDQLEVDGNTILHLHYCSECTKRCVTCGRFLLIVHFEPLHDHPAVLDYMRSVQIAGEEPLGMLMGRDLVQDECLGCRPFLPSTKEAPSDSEEIDEDSSAEAFSRLEAILNRMKT